MCQPSRIVVTSALPYANGPIHLGHLVEYIQTDIYTRALRLEGEDAVYCCADDTHGTPIELNAARQGIPPEELIARYLVEHQRDFADFHIRFDSYYSTNSPENKHFSDLIFSRLRDNGDIYTQDVEQTWCDPCHRFLPDRFVRGRCPRCGAADQYGDNCEACGATYGPTDLTEPACALCGHPPTRKSSLHYFFRLNRYADRLRDWLNGNDKLQDEIRNYILKWIDGGLRDWDISRDAPYFGFPILGETDKYYYVWLDAPIGYISSTRHLCERLGRRWESYWTEPGGRIIHFIGKDIIYFHFLFWPAMLMGAGFNLPENLIVHGFLTINGEKMSKSRGTFLTARDYLDRGLDPDCLRFYYAANLSPKMADLDLDTVDFQNRVNGELIGNFANFANRSLTFLARQFDGRTCDFREPGLEAEVEVRVGRVREHFRRVDFRAAVREIMEISDIGNRTFQERAPWALLKTDPAAAHAFVSWTVNLVRILGILLKPIVPVMAARLERQLALPAQDFRHLAFDLKDHTIGAPEPLMAKLDASPLIQADPFDRIDLRVGRVLSVSSHPKADKLVVLQVDLGGETRQLVAGIRTHYTDAELTGRHIVVVANLKPANLRGQPSQGMLLAASGEAGLGVVTTDAPPGTPVRPAGSVYDDTPQIEIGDFAQVTLRGVGGTAMYADRPLLADGRPVTIDRGIEGGIK